MASTRKHGETTSVAVPAPPPPPPPTTTSPAGTSSVERTKTTTASQQHPGIRRSEAACVQTSSEKLLTRAQELVSRILKHPALADLPEDVDLEDVEAAVASARGQALHVRVQRFDGEHLDVTLPANADVATLKRAVQKAASKRASHTGQQISWKYTWSKYCLVYSHDGSRERLLDEHRLLQDMGIKDGAQLKFARQLLSRDIGGRRHVRAKRGRRHTSFGAS